VEWILTNKAIVSLAVLGAVLSVSASVLQLRGSIGTLGAKWINGAGYALMALSMALFVISGYQAQ